jgi:hypothetical protein
MDDYKVTCSPYAERVLLEMAEQIKEERKFYFYLTDEEWDEFVKNSIEWKEL